MSLKQYIKNQAALIEDTIDNSLPANDEHPEIIHEAMRYSSLGGGKRLRAILALAACERLGGKPEKALGFAAAIEMIHAYTLIHDDLPCMDDDDFRRGKPTNHKIYGEAIAVLAGDALLTKALEVISNLSHDYNISGEVVLRIMSEVTNAIGSQGLIGGQVVDLLSEGKPIDKKNLQYIHQKKTGELFKVSLRGGALIGGATEKQLNSITFYAEQLGLAFQITDDILDLVGDEAKLGKAVGSDLRLEKATFPAVYGFDNAKQMAKECIAHSKESLENLPAKDYILEKLAEFVLNREF